MKLFNWNLDIPTLELTSTDIEYATEFSAGFDIMTKDDLTIEPHSLKQIKTGLFLKNPSKPRYFSFSLFGFGFDIVPELQIRSKSGLTFKKQLSVLNSPGTVDADFSQEICVLMFNHSDNTHDFNKGDKVVQGVVSWVFRPHSIKVKNNKREGGFGSTGK